MDLAFSAEDLKFRDEVRDWIAKNFDAHTKNMQAQSKNGYLDKDTMVAWQKKLYERGWIAPDWPVEHGGAGFTSTPVLKARPGAARSTETWMSSFQETSCHI